MTSCYIGFAMSQATTCVAFLSRRERRVEHRLELLTKLPSTATTSDGRSSSADTRESYAVYRDEVDGRGT